MKKITTKEREKMKRKKEETQKGNNERKPLPGS